MKWRLRKTAAATALTGAAMAAFAMKDGAYSAEGGENKNVRPIQAESLVEGLAFRPLSRLPKAPAGAENRQGCEHLLKSPQSAAGREVAAAGWAVTREARIGGYDAVSFVGGFEQGTSGTCALSDGNVGIFDGSGLVAVAYAPASSKLTIGRVEPFESTGLRIWDSDMAPQPVADIRLDSGSRLVIAPLALEERFCGGRSVVPNIYHQPITKARDLLRRKGWSPTDQGDASSRSDMREAALAQRGVREVDSCSGTGFAFCSYNYTLAQSVLHVTTIGDAEDPMVSSYTVSCLAVNPAIPSASGQGKLAEQGQPTESDKNALDMAHTACKNGAFKDLFTAFSMSPAVRLKYSSARITYVVLNAQGKSLSETAIESNRYRDFPVKTSDFYYKPAKPAVAGDEEEYLDLQFNQSQSNDYSVEWSRIHYDGQSDGGDDRGRPLNASGKPIPDGTHQDAEGQLLFRPTADCWELTNDIRWDRGRK